MISDIFVCGLIVAALTSLVIESPAGRWLKSALAGEPSPEAFEVWRANGVDEATIPRWRYPWLKEGLECVTCVSFWSGLVVSSSWNGWSCPLHLWVTFWAGSWIIGRTLLAVAQAVEGHI